MGTGGYDLDPDTPGFPEAQADYAARSEAARRLPGARLDLEYGPHPRQRLDAFPAGANAPALVFLRGGYWKAGSKEERRFPALEWRPRGVAWIVPNYRLAPEFALPDIVGDARSALRWILDNADALGVDPARLHLVGNSAGAHLAATLAAEPAGRAIRSLTLISGLYDLVPLLDEAPNRWLGLDAEAARALSPINSLPPPDLPMAVCCGGAETPAFKRQTAAYAERCGENGNPVERFESPGKHHIGIIGECGEPGSPVFEAIRGMVEAPG